jgi:cobyrinic acid a,c-diamide synthase
MKPSNAFLISGTHSGAGKTTATLALLSLLAEKGYEPQAFKAGPDFIDPGFHKFATGRDSYNLDRWMMGVEGIRSCFEAHHETTRVVEGMGGLFDGQDGTELGSSAWLAKELQIAVVLVIDAWGMTGSTGAVMDGFVRFDSNVKIAAVILNRVGSRRHYEMIVNALSSANRDLVFGYVPYDSEFIIKERHLGLTNAAEVHNREKLKSRLVEVCKETLRWQDLCARLRLTRADQSQAQPATHTKPARARIGIAADEAFSFYYKENFDLLEAAGAELIRFSPLRDSKLPTVDGLYIGGGYPEIFAQQLSQNTAMKTAIAAAAHSGMPIYAECGGMMYLGESLTDFDGNVYEMAAVVPASFQMDRKFLAIKYVEIQTRLETVLGPAGTRIRGQEFHQSRRTGDPSPACYSVTTSDGQSFEEGSHQKNVLASYLHLHFRSNPNVPASFVEACHRYRAENPHSSP